MDSDAAGIERAYADLSAAGLPAVRGEVVKGDVAGYHYYPDREQVWRWLADEGLDVGDEVFSQDDGWGYRHLLLRPR